MTAFDPSVIAAQAGGDPELEREVLAMYLAQSPADLARLRAAAEADRGDIAHRIKGAARAVGAGEVAAAAEVVERSGGEEDIEALAAALRAALTEIERHLATVAHRREGA